MGPSVFLEDFADLSAACHRFDGGGLSGFLRAERVKALGWPKDVVEQWLYDHAEHDPFLVDYGYLDLAAISWRDESIPVREFLTMPTGPSESDAIEMYARNPDHWSEVRRPLGVPQHWESHGTWLRRPLLIDGALLQPVSSGLQVIEGRTRVGVLRGLARRGRQLAQTHAAWVARSR